MTAMFGPDGALYLVDYGAVRDFGQSDPRSLFRSEPEPCATPGNCRYNGPLVQISQTGSSGGSAGQGKAAGTTTTTMVRADRRSARVVIVVVAPVHEAPGG